MDSRSSCDTYCWTLYLGFLATVCSKHGEQGDVLKPGTRLGYHRRVPTVLGMWPSIMDLPLCIVPPRVWDDCFLEHIGLATPMRAGTTSPLTGLVCAPMWMLNMSDVLDPSSFFTFVFPTTHRDWPQHEDKEGALESKQTLHPCTELCHRFPSRPRTSSSRFRTKFHGQSFHSLSRRRRLHISWTRLERSPRRGSRTCR